MNALKVTTDGIALAGLTEREIQVLTQGFTDVLTLFILARFKRSPKSAKGGAKR